MFTEFRMWVSIQLFDLAITICPFEEVRAMLRATCLETANKFLDD